MTCYVCGKDTPLHRPSYGENKNGKFATFFCKRCNASLVAHIGKNGEVRLVSHQLSLWR